MNKFPVLFFALMILFAACKSKKAADKDNSERHTEMNEKQLKPNPNELRPIVVDNQYRWPGSTDPFHIVESVIKGDSLILTVEYGGGCREHEFKMFTNGSWIKTMPLKMNLWLEHKNNGDNCRALIREELKFDLKAARNQSSDTVILIINGDEENTIKYSYR